MNSDRKPSELKAWYELLDDEGYRMESPDAYHADLMRQAEELFRTDVIEWADWMELKELADAAYIQALEEAITNRMADPDE